MDFVTRTCKDLAIKYYSKEVGSMGWLNNGLEVKVKYLEVPDEPGDCPVLSLG
jgi:hypothetical protein